LVTAPPRQKIGVDVNWWRPGTGRRAVKKNHCTGGGTLEKQGSHERTSPAASGKKGKKNKQQKRKKGKREWTDGAASNTPVERGRSKRPKYQKGEQKPVIGLQERKTLYFKILLKKMHKEERSPRRVIRKTKGRKRRGSSSG